LWVVVILVVVFVVGSVIPEGRPVFVKINALLILPKFVPKMFACLVDLVMRCEVVVLAEVLTIEIIKFLSILCVKTSQELMRLLNMIFTALSQHSTFVCCGLGAIFYMCGYDVVSTVMPCAAW
jgi:hypothetical protein